MSAEPVTPVTKQRRDRAIRCIRFVGPFHLGVVFISSNFLILATSLSELTGKRIPRPSAYGLASENIFLIAAGSELDMSRS
jgi:hypothetical protein